MKIKIENKEYNLIDSMGELTIQQFKDVNKLKELYESEEFTEVEYITEVASILTGIETDVIMSLDLQSFNDLYNEVVILSNEKFTDFKLTDEKIIINNVEYKFQINLDTMPMGQWWEMNDLMKKNDFWEYAPKFFAMLIRPVDEKGKLIKYNITEIDSRVELFNSNLKLKFFYPVYTFFLTFWLELRR